MTFKELQDLIDKSFGATRLADIAKELDVSPQVVSNWKSRNQVPYKYVKIIRKKINELKNESSVYTLQSPILGQISASENEIDDSFIELFSHAYKIIKKNFLWLVLVPLSFGLVATICFKYFVEPVYISSAKILPHDGKSGKSEISAIAQNFGIGLSQGRSTDLTSSELFPELIRSRLLSKILLKKEFDTIKYGPAQPLLNILLKQEVLTDTLNFEKWQSKAISKLQKLISVKNTSKSSPLLRLSVSANEAKFAKDLASALVVELDKLQKSFKNEKIEEKLIFIDQRMSEVSGLLLEAEESVKTFRDENRDIRKSPSLLLEESRLLRDVKIQLELYITLKKELELSQIEQIENSSMFSVLDEPEVPLSKLSPKLNRVFFISIIFSLVCVLAFAFIKSWLEDNWESQIKPIFE